MRSPRWGHFFDASLASARYRGGWRPRGESSHSWMSICWALLRRSSRSGPGSSWDALFSRRTLSTANRSLNVRGCERERSMGSSLSCRIGRWFNPRRPVPDCLSGVRPRPDQSRPMHLKSATPPERSMIARRRWLTLGPLKLPSGDMSAQSGSRLTGLRTKADGPA